MTCLRAILAALLLCACGAAGGAQAEEMTAAVGATPGVFEVDETGAAVYRVPLFAPPGPGGLRPVLGLRYHSRAGSRAARGAAGRGWDLEGLSSVRRCAHYDPEAGRRRPVQLTPDDRLCLDGRVLEPATDAHDGRTFSLRDDPLVRIEMTRAAADAPDDAPAITAHLRDGLRLEYAAALAAPGGETLLWRLARLRDRSGNTLRYAYRKDGALARIAYGPNALAFSYREHPDPPAQYFAGATLGGGGLLTAVRAYAGETVARAYHLEYNAAARLVALRECDGGGACLRPLEFRWTTDSDSFSYTRRFAPSLRADFDRYRFHLGDFNGDGRADWYEVRAPGDAGPDRVLLNTGDDFVTVEAGDTRVASERELGDFYIADFDGDGRSDIYQFRRDRLADALHLARGAGDALYFLATNGADTGACARACLRFGDFDGDGRMDVYRVRRGGAVFLSRGEDGFERAAGVGAEIAAAAVRVADFNGDGLADVYHIRAAGADDLHLNIAPGRFRRVAGASTNFRFNAARPESAARVRSGDFNGDGLADILFFPDGDGTELHLSRGDGRYAARAGPAFRARRPDENLEGAMARVKLADLDGDGRVDFYYASGAFEHDARALDDLYLSRADGYAERAVGAHTRTPDAAAARDALRFGDFDGDGDADLVSLAAAPYAEAYVNRRRPAAIKTIRDGLGRVIEIDYAPLFAAHAAAASELRYPDAAPGGAQVVARTRARPAAAEGETVYRYGGGRRRDGALLFAWIERDDLAAGLRRRTTYHTDEARRGLAAERLTYALDTGRLLSSLSLAYDTGDGETRLAARVAEHYDLDGAPMLETAVRHLRHDEFGNPVELETRVARAGEGGFVRTEHRRYRNDPERGLFGLPEMIETTDADGANPEVRRVAHFEYDDAGRLAAQTLGAGEPNAPTLQIAYDRFGNRIEEAVEGRVLGEDGWRRERQVVARRYDAAGRFEIERVNPAGHTVRFTRDARTGLPLTVVGADGARLRRQYDGWGRLMTETRDDGATLRLAYRRGLPEDAPASAAYAVDVSARGRPSAQRLYDALERLVQTRATGFDGRPVFEDFEYDTRGRLTAFSAPHFAGDEQHWHRRRHDALGRLREATAPGADGATATVRFAYDGARVERVGPLGDAGAADYDARGLVTLIADAAGATVRYAYDAAGRLREIAPPTGGQRFAYDAFGRLARVADSGAGARAFVRDAFGRVVEERAPDGARRQMFYDRLGRLRKRVEPGGVSHWSYDASPRGVGKLAMETRDGHAREYAYDAAGRLASINDHRGFYVEARYDDAGRLASVRRRHGPEVERIYNRHGHLEALRGPPFATAGDDETTRLAARARAYALRADYYRRAADAGRAPPAALRDAAAALADAARRLEDAVAPRALRWPVAFGYLRTAFARLVAARERQAGPDRAGLARRDLNEARALLDAAARRLPDTADAARRDDNGQLRYWEVLARDAAGRVTDERAGNGVRTTRRFAPGAPQPTRIVVARGGDILSDLRYRYDAAGNLVELAAQPEGRVEHFDYDQLHRLASAVGGPGGAPARVAFHLYDDLGRPAFRSGAGHYSYAGDSHAALRVGDDNYRYDAAGRLTAGGALRVAWPAFGKPARLAKGARWSRFRYDARRGRIEQRRSDGDRILYFGKLHERALRADGGVERRHYIAAGGRVVLVAVDDETAAGRRARALRYLHYDARESVRVVTDGVGGLVERFAYGPFGERRRLGDGARPALIRRGFTGHEHLDDFGLIHMNGRLYHAGIKRFLSPDPYIPAPLSTQAHDRYGYAFNNPFRFVDPDGLFFKKLFRGVRRVLSKAARFIRDNARVIAAAAIGYYAGALFSQHLLEASLANLTWSPGAMASGAYMQAYNSALSSAALAGGAVAGATAGALSGGGLRGALAGAAGGAALAGVGAHYAGRWSAGRVLANTAVNGATAAAAGGDLRAAAFNSLAGGGLKYAAWTMRQRMIAQSMLNPDNAGGLSAGYAGDNFKLGGGRANPAGAADQPLGGAQGGPGRLFGVAYAPGSALDKLVELYAGPHDFLNDFYFYDASGNIRASLTPAQSLFGQAVSAGNLLLATPFAAAAATPDFTWSLAR